MTKFAGWYLLRLNQTPNQTPTVHSSCERPLRRSRFTPHSSDRSTFPANPTTSDRKNR